MHAAARTTRRSFPLSGSTGKERDTESGNDYFEARYYTAAAGRFMSPDWSAKVEPVPYATMGDPQSLNLYAYVRNNPITGFDPDGHMGNADFSQMMMLAMGAQSALFMEQRAEQAARAQQQNSNLSPMDKVAMKAEAGALKLTRQALAGGHAGTSPQLGDRDRQQELRRAARP
jgi:RHS repeat-associated protein